MKWIWTFGCGTPYKGKYVIIDTEEGDGREYMFEHYGQNNCCMSYPYEKGMRLVEKYGYKCINDISLIKLTYCTSYIPTDELVSSWEQLQKRLKEADDMYHFLMANRTNPEDFIGKKYKVIKHDWAYELMEDENNGKR